MGDKATIGGAVSVWVNPDDPSQTVPVTNSYGEKAPKTDSGEEYTKKPYHNEYSYNEDSKKWIKTGKFVPQSTSHYATEEEAAGKRVSGESTDWGAADIGKDDFVNADGSQKTIEEIYTALDAKLPNITDNKLKLQIRDMMSKYTGAPAEEKGFLAKERGFAERTAEMGRKSDMYGLQKEAGAVGAQMRSGYGGGSMGMRGAIGGQAGMKKGAGLASDKYGLGMEKAAFAEEKGMYGLEKTAGAEFEAGVSDWMQGDWFETPTGGVDQVTDYKQGGRVTNKKSFLDVLTAIPDAGGS